MSNVQAIKIGNTVNIYLNGKFHKKSFETGEEANVLFSLVLKAKENPTEENLKAVYYSLNEKTRIAMIAGLEADVDSGEVFLAGFNTPIPMELVEVIKNYHENNYPLQSIINFWKLLMINPDKRVRNDLFNFISKHDFVLTDKGYMIVYKAVVPVYVNTIDEDLKAFVGYQYNHVKKDWKVNPAKYIVYMTNDEQFSITKVDVFEKWDVNEKGVTLIGNLNELHVNADKACTKTKVSHYTDKFSKTMKIELGKVASQERKLCDADPKVDCSQGLHVGATSYVSWYGNSNDTILVCYVNPANVIAVPDSESTKMRVSEYFPFAKTSFKNGKIEIIKEPYFESDYENIEKITLKKMIEKVKTEEAHMDNAINSEKENRAKSEIEKILKNRLVELV